MSSSPPNKFEETIIGLFYQLQVSKYMASAGLAIILYDWLLTLSVEMRYIWQARWTWVKAVFLINRYFVPMTIGFGVYGWSGEASWINVDSCKVYVLVDAYTMLAFFSSLHWIVAMRAWALWSRTYAMGAFIWGSFIIYLVSTAVVTAKALTTYIPTPVFNVNVCFGKLPDYVWIIWLPSIIFETIIFGLTAIKAFQHSRKKVETPILTTLYRDGFIYFIFICLNSFLNLLIWAVAPQGYLVLYKFFSTAICAVAGAHLVLDLIHVGHLTGASQRSGQPPVKVKGLPGFGGAFGGGMGGLGSFGYTHSHAGEVFEMMSAPSFMQDPPEYDQTIDQMMTKSTRSMNEWVAPVEWESNHGHTSVMTDSSIQSRTGLLTSSKQEFSQDNFSFPPPRVGAGRKLTKSKTGTSTSNPYHLSPNQVRNSEASQRRPKPKISSPIPDTLHKNGVPNSPPPAFSSPTTYYSQQSSHLQPQQQYIPPVYASGSRSPPPSSNSPTRERTIRFHEFEEHPYRSSPQAI